MCGGGGHFPVLEQAVSNNAENTCVYVLGYLPMLEQAVSHDEYVSVFMCVLGHCLK